MRMSIRPVVGRRGAIMALYQSQLLDETPRLPSGLLSMDPRAVEPIAGPEANPLVICSFCRDIAWPIGVPEADASWIGIPDYYRRGGSGEVAVSHGICPGCIERMFAEDDWAAADLYQGRVIAQDDTAWSAPRFHTLTISDVRRETADAVSLAFAVPARLRAAYGYVPGQYLTSARDDRWRGRAAILFDLLRAG